MISDEDRRWLLELGEKVSKFIDEELDADRAYYNFRLTVDVLGVDFGKLEELVLIDDGWAFCAFCHKPTHFYDRRQDLHLCALCFAEIEVKKRNPSNAVHQMPKSHEEDHP